ncbi:MAG: serine protease [Dehalococcoidia bacterium]|nr:serine protease [Dehalococcoidia bacterium]
MDLTAAIRRVQPSIVQITFYAHDVPGEGTTRQPINLHGPFGTGFVASLEGHIITANHVVENGFNALKSIESKFKNVSVGFAYPNTQNMRGNFTLMNFDLIEADKVHDIALLKLKSARIPRMFADKPALELAPVTLNPTRPEDGAVIGVSGYPLNQSVLVTNGGFMATSWAFDLQELKLPGAPEFYRKLDIADSYLADINVNPGNSGGPVYLASDGSVIGVCVAYLPTSVRDDTGNTANYYYSSGLAVVVPSRYVCDLLKRHTEGQTSKVQPHS